MKLLLTSAGISNASIEAALVELLGKPVAESRALYIPTAVYPIENGPVLAREVIRGALGDPFCELGWKSLGVLELSALPTIKRERWLTLVEASDALLVGGGDCQYLTYWMQQSGLAELLPALLQKTVYVGLSAGSMIMTRWGTSYHGHCLPPGTDKSLGLLDFALHPHLDHPARGQYPRRTGEAGGRAADAFLPDRRPDRAEGARRQGGGGLGRAVETGHALAGAAISFYTACAALGFS